MRAAPTRPGESFEAQSRKRGNAAFQQSPQPPDFIPATVDKCPLRNTLTTLKSYQDNNSMPTPHHPSAAARRALKQLGGDLRDARRRRRLTMAVVADRAFTSRATLQRVEAGDPAVSIGIYAAVLHTLGLLDGLGGLADLSRDPVGRALADEFLPQRVRPKAAAPRL